MRHIHHSCLSCGSSPPYVAALTSTTVELGGELADGLMPFLWTAERVAKSKVWIDRDRAKASGLGALDMTLGLPTFIGEDVQSLRESAPAVIQAFRR